MRKITQQATEAFLHGEEVSIRNTSTFTSGSIPAGTGEIHLGLHGNRIATAKLDTGGLPMMSTLQVTNAGWSTRTTYDRLNALPGVRVNQSKGQPYLNGEPWDGSWTYVTPAVEVKQVGSVDYPSWQVNVPSMPSMPFDSIAAAHTYAEVEAVNRGLTVRK